MNNNQIVLHLNNALFSLGYARQKLGDSDWAERVNDTITELQTLAEVIYDGPVVGVDLPMPDELGPVGADPEPQPQGLNGPAEPTTLADLDHAKMHSTTVVQAPTDIAYKETEKCIFMEDWRNDGMAFKSIEPASIVGANRLLVFNTKTRAMALYTASDDDGLHMKGTTIKNFDPDLSYSKTIRKPNLQLSQYLTSDQPSNDLYNIKGAAKKLTGRINGHCLLVRVF